jgi:hypothetical protein
MSFKPNESLLMAYLYGELQGEEKASVEQYLAQHPEAMKELESLAFVRNALGQVEDKEVIAPPIVMGGDRTRYFWNTNLGRTFIGIAASLTLVILVGKWTGLRLNYTDKTMTISFGRTVEAQLPNEMGAQVLTADEVQEMINTSLEKNNETVQASLDETHQQLNESIRKNLASHTNAAFNELVRKTSMASEEQIRQFALTLQADNASMIKDYMTLNSSDQRKYMEELLVDFAKYLEQQHRNDLQVLQARLNSIEQNTDLFKYETEQILTSIISSVDNPNSFTTKN